MESQLTQMRDRMTTINLEFESVNDDRLKFLGEIDELKRKLQSARQEKEAAERKFNKEVNTKQIIFWVGKQQKQFSINCCNQCLNKKLKRIV